MPLGDRTGPWGHGPMTGRGMGYCAGFSYPGYMSPGFGYGRGGGFGRGFGRGRGWRRGGFMPVAGYAHPWMSPYGYPGPGYYSMGDEKTYLEGQVKVMEDQLDQVKKRLEELSKEKTEPK